MVSIAQATVELSRIAESPTVATLSRAFAQAGYELALVGGSVRDALLGREVTDLDFATNARPDKTREILQTITSNTRDLGVRFGTIAAKVKGEMVEITTYRAEIYRSTSRKPEVTYSDAIENDLVRRDFTVNALALMLPEKKLVDVAGGVEHLLAGVLDTPDTPEKSFTDDPLRMMRAARFAAQLGFTPVPRVITAMRELSARLEIISAERIRDELVKTLASDDPVSGVRLLVETGLCGRFLPELTALVKAQDDQNRHKDVYEHSLTVLAQAIELENARRAAGVAANPDVVLRLAALLHDIGKPATRKFEQGAVTFHNHDLVGARLAKKRLRSLRFDNDMINQVTRLIELHMRFFGYNEGVWSDSAVRRYVRDAQDQLEQLHILTRADVTTKDRRKAVRLARAYDDLERRIEVLAEQEELAAVRPELNGEQIMQILGIKPGRTVGAAYKFLLDLRLDEGELGQEEATRRLLEWYQKF
ncbi:CCA tRNA nucleotidyltransferase [Canibacter sp. lx-45]|uniref:CCA tRNA nucleotidyltransferase n=1 Tax=Canibacter zhuwentaonis TaxID=2837491 RepID=UPI001BDCECDE|nr:CCA tRNA nucleotidyltransferase [Canibacter zhuwentaonis]MBT1035358.1 CCA tRNA nucleotidyltransferase [Canibacter zhuwentaonis]